MAPLPENNTVRLMIDYTSAGIVHTLMLRFGDSIGSADAATTAAALCADLAPFVNAGDSFFRARYSDHDSDFSLPIFWTTIPGTSTGAGFEEDPESAFVSVVGRSNAGRRVRWELFTVAKISTDWPLDNRYSAGESTNADDIIAAFVAATEDATAPVRAIDKAPVNVYDYLNIAKNGYWQRKQRNA